MIRSISCKMSRWLVQFFQDEVTKGPNMALGRHIHAARPIRLRTHAQLGLFADLPVLAIDDIEDGHGVAWIEIGRIVCDWLFHPTALAAPDFDPSDTVAIFDAQERRDRTLPATRRTGACRCTGWPGRCSSSAAAPSVRTRWRSRYAAVRLVCTPSIWAASCPGCLPCIPAIIIDELAPHIGQPC